MTVADVAAVAGPGIGSGLGLLGGFRFIRWFFEFTAKRRDIREARLDGRELQLEKRFNDRLRHVEEELEIYRTATMRLVNRIAEIMPQDPVLGEVAKILRRSVPVVPLDPALSDLVRRAGDAVEGRTQ